MSAIDEAATSSAADPTRGSRLVVGVAAKPGVALVPGVSEYIAVFHEWIRTQALGELLIDVASYQHVPGGPGVLLVGFESDYSVSIKQGRVALACRSKRPSRPAESGVEGCLRKLMSAAARLEGEAMLSDPPQFAWDEARVVFNDRLRHPNDPTHADTHAPLVRRAFERVWSRACSVSPSSGDRRERLSFLVRSA